MRGRGASPVEYFPAAVPPFFVYRGLRRSAAYSAETLKKLEELFAGNQKYTPVNGLARS